MDAQPNKVDMSLDDIIKLSKKEKQKSTKQVGARGRGNIRGYGGHGQRGNYTTRGRGAGRGKTGKQSILNANQNTNNNNNNNNNINNYRGGTGRGSSLRGRGGTVRGRGVSRGRSTARGRGGSSIVNTVGVNRNTAVNTVKGRARGRGMGRGSQAQTRTFTNTNKNSNNSVQAIRTQRLNAVKSQADLLQKKEMALKKLQSAKKTMQDINKALQKSARSDLINQKRGLPLQTDNGRPASGRGKRKLLAGLARQDFKGSNMSLVSNNSSRQGFRGSNLSLASAAAGRQMINTAVTITNQSASPRKRRQWRPSPNKSDVTVHVSNQMKLKKQSAPVSPPKLNIMEQLKNLKPAVPTTYKFQKNVFASNTTKLSLNDRFSAPSSSSISSDQEMPLEGRKVFI